MRCPREAKIILEFSYGCGGAWEPTLPSGLVASHSDVSNDMRFVMTTILDFDLRSYA